MIGLEPHIFSVAGAKPEGGLPVVTKSAFFHQDSSLKHLEGTMVVVFVSPVRLCIWNENCEISRAGHFKRPEMAFNSIRES